MFVRSFITDTNFPGVLFLAIEQIPILEEHNFCYQTDTNFPGALFLYFCRLPIDKDFPGDLFWLGTDFPGFSKLISNNFKQIGNFQEGTPLPTNISVIGLVGCFRLNLYYRFSLHAAEL